MLLHLCPIQITARVKLDEPCEKLCSSAGLSRQIEAEYKHHVPLTSPFYPFRTGSEIDLTVFTVDQEFTGRTKSAEVFQIIKEAEMRPCVIFELLWAIETFSSKFPFDALVALGASVNASFGAGAGRWFASAHAARKVTEVRPISELSISNWMGKPLSFLTIPRSVPMPLWEVRRASVAI